MRFEWSDSYDIGEKIKKMKENHYRHIFPEAWPDILAISSRLYSREKLLKVYVGNEEAGICIAESIGYELKLRDFSVLPEYRGMKLGEKLLGEIESSSKKNGVDILSTIIYPKPEKPEHYKDMERFGMACFFLRHDLLAYWKLGGLSDLELAGLEAYENYFPEYLPLLRQFGKWLR